jgi:hypothetical protein
MGRAVARVGSRAYDANFYAPQIDRWGSESSEDFSNDLKILTQSGAVDPELILPRHTKLPKGATVENLALMQLNGIHMQFRRAVAGFNPPAYAEAHPSDCIEGGQNPIVHWLKHGRPLGPWSQQVISPLDKRAPPATPLRVALHAHFYYPDLVSDLIERLAKNRTICDLFVSTDSAEKAKYLVKALDGHQGKVKVKVMPNRGRDFGPLLTGFAKEIESGDYDLWGHVHGKKSVEAGDTLGNAWRNFLWENLIGGQFPMLDIMASAFASDPTLGLAFPVDPHLIGWDANRDHAEALAGKMGLPWPLADNFDFPVGAMFFFRPKALRKLFELDLPWEAYPEEPVPIDGTLLHAIERILPFVANSGGFRIASIRVPHTTW